MYILAFIVSTCVDLRVFRPDRFLGHTFCPTALGINSKGGRLIHHRKCPDAYSVNNYNGPFSFQELYIPQECTSISQAREDTQFYIIAFPHRLASNKQTQLSILPN